MNHNCSREDIFFSQEMRILNIRKKRKTTCIIFASHVNSLGAFLSFFLPDNTDEQKIERRMIASNIIINYQRKHKVSISKIESTPDVLRVSKMFD